LIAETGFRPRSTIETVRDFIAKDRGRRVLSVRLPAVTG
jgi:hypothetical protein